MQIKNKAIALFVCMGGMLAGIATSCGSRQAMSLNEGTQLKTMHGFPQGEAGFEQGISACYAGWIHEQLVIAGGCNFPEIPAAEGGAKRFYKNIYAAQITDSLLDWRKIGELPVAAAYGVSVSTSQGMICVGGTNSEGASKRVCRVAWTGESQDAHIEELPSLPCTLDNMGGALLEDILYVVGGNADGKPSNRLFSLSLSNLVAGWQELPSLPGHARVQPVCVGLKQGGEYRLYVWGGFAPYHDNQSATLSVDGCAYVPSQKEWVAVATPMGSDSCSISLGGGTIIAVSDSTALCMGGVHKERFLSALQREECMKKAMVDNDQISIDSLKAAARTYLLQDPSYYQFNDRICVYNAHRNTWHELSRTTATARAGAALVGDGRRFFSVNGELKPGIRTSEIVEITMK